jgi:RNA polymerase sigma factor (sigma-70 family)
MHIASNRSMTLKNDDEVMAALKQFDQILKNSISKTLRKNPRIARWIHEEDVYQEVALRMIRACKTVDINDDKHFIHLMLLQLSRTIIDCHRKIFGPNGWATNLKTDPEAIHQKSASSDQLIRNHSRNEQPISAEDWIDFHESIEKLLDEREQQVFMMLFYGNYTDIEVAQFLACSDRTVRRDWRNARIKLQEHIQQKRNHGDKKD